MGVLPIMIGYSRRAGPEGQGAADPLQRGREGAKASSRSRCAASCALAARPPQETHHHNIASMRRPRSKEARSGGADRRPVDAKTIAAGACKLHAPVTIGESTCSRRREGLPIETEELIERDETLEMKRIVRTAKD
jgi:hypothetical protein